MLHILPVANVKLKKISKSVKGELKCPNNHYVSNGIHGNYCYTCGSELYQSSYLRDVNPSIKEMALENILYLAERIPNKTLLLNQDISYFDNYSTYNTLDINKLNELLNIFRDNYFDILNNNEFILEFSIEIGVIND